MKKVWILSDNKSGWLNKLFEYRFIKAEAIGEKGQSGAAALAAFDKALKREAPKYALWSFAREKGAMHSKNLALFISTCKKNAIIPVLTTAVEAKSKKKNAAIIACGERYIDFAELSSYSEICTKRGYSKLGKEAIAAKVLVDFPEIITPDIEVRKSSGNICDTGKLTLGTNKVRDGKFLVFTARIGGELKENQTIVFGHGYMESYGKWFEVTDKEVIHSSYTSWAKVPLKKTPCPHGLTVKNYITVILTADNDGVGNNLTIVTDGGVYKKSGYGWNACQGDIFVS